MRFGVWSSSKIKGAGVAALGEEQQYIHSSR